MQTGELTSAQLLDLNSAINDLSVKLANANDLLKTKKEFKEEMDLLTKDSVYDFEYIQKHYSESEKADIYLNMLLKQKGEIDSLKAKIAIISTENKAIKAKMKGTKIEPTVNDEKERETKRTDFKPFKEKSSQEYYERVRNSVRNGNSFSLASNQTGSPSKQRESPSFFSVRQQHLLPVMQSNNRTNQRIEVTVNVSLPQNEKEIQQSKLND